GLSLCVWPTMSTRQRGQFGKAICPPSSRTFSSPAAHLHWRQGRKLSTGSLSEAASRRPLPARRLGENFLRQASGDRRPTTPVSPARRKEPEKWTHPRVPAQPR